MPDWLGLVGDSADGFPGLPGWGAKAASAVLGRYGSIEAIPSLASSWEVDLSATRTASLAATLEKDYERAMLFKKLATCVVRRDLLPPGRAALDSLAWQGPAAGFSKMCDRLEAPNLVQRAKEIGARGSQSVPSDN